MNGAMLATPTPPTTPASDRKYSSTQLELPGVMAAAVLALAKRIPDEVLAEKGREDRPHVTVRYGIESNDAEVLRKYFEQADPVSIELGSTLIFPATEGADYDVVYVEVFSNDLPKLNRGVADVTPCTGALQGYTPHVTLAYVKAGRGWDFAFDNRVSGMRGTVGAVTFSPAEGAEVRLPLRGGALFAAQRPPAASPHRAQRFFRTQLALEEEAPELVTVDGVEYVKGKPQHVFPKGDWMAIDGRPISVTDEDLGALVRFSSQDPCDIPITFDHEEDVAKGSKAAGWVRAFEARADGLWATEVFWTKPAYEELKAGEWRYLSGDALGFGDIKRGERWHPRRTVAISLVPKPGIRGLNPVALSADKGTPSLVEGRKENKNMPTSEEGKGTPAADPKLDALLGNETFLQSLGAAVGAKLGAQLVELPAVQEKLSAAASARAVEVASERAEAKVKEQFAARDREALIDATLLGFEKSGQLLAEEREDYRELFRLDFERTKRRVEALPKRGPGQGTGSPRVVDISDGTAASSGRVRVTFGVDEDGKKVSVDVPEKFSMADTRGFTVAEKEAVLTRAAQWQAEQGIGNLDAAIAAVMKGDDIPFRQALSAGEYKPRLRAVPGSGVELDQDFLKYVRDKMERGAIPTNVLPEQIQRFAIRQTFTTLASLQAPTRFTLPIVVGFAKGKKIGSYGLPEFAGVGPAGIGDERVSYPKTSTEDYLILPDRPMGDNDTDIPEGTWGADWTTVDLKFYPYREWVGRRTQAAGSAAGFDTMTRATAKAQERLAMQKENIQRAYLQTSGNFGSNVATRSGEQKWDMAGSNPLDDIVGAMVAVWRSCGRLPDQSLCGQDPFWALRKNRTLNELAGKYQATKKEPSGLLPIETLIGWFGMNWAVSDQLGSTVPGGASPTSLWGTAWTCVATGQGETEAPRFGLTVTSPNTPLLRIVSNDLRGTNGSDAAAATLAYAIGAGLAGAGFLIQTASNQIEVPTA